MERLILPQMTVKFLEFCGAKDLPVNDNNNLWMKFCWRALFGFSIPKSHRSISVRMQ